MSIVIYHFTIANEINTNHAIINAIINLLWEKNTIVPRFVLAVVQCCYHLKTVEENGIFSLFFLIFSSNYSSLCVVHQVVTIVNLKMRLSAKTQ